MNEWTDQDEYRDGHDIGTRVLLTNGPASAEAYLKRREQSKLYRAEWIQGYRDAITGEC